MKKIGFIFFLGIIFLGNTTNAQTWQWAKALSDSLNENVSTKITVDKLGNSYALGYFKRKMVLAGNISLNSKGDYDIYVIKYNDIGQVQWAKSFGGLGDDRAFAITVDSTNSLIIGGYISQTVIFGIDTLSSIGQNISFLARIDSLGNSYWASAYGNWDGNVVSDVCVDSVGNVFATGSFKGSNVNFGNGHFLTSNGNATNFFVIKVDSAGATQWAKSGGCGSLYDYGISLTLSPNQQNVLAVGDYWCGNFIFQGDTIHNIDPNNTTDSYFISLNAQSGAKFFLRNISGGSYTDAKGIATDKRGNIYITGNCEMESFNSPATSTNDTLTSTFGNIHIYLFKYTENGTFIWSKGIGFTSWGHDVRDVQVDNQNRIIIAGRVEGYIACDTFITSTPGGFLAQFDSLSACHNLISVGTIGLDPGSFVSAAIDEFDNIYVHGYMQYTTTFGTIPFVCNNDYEVFIAKYGFNSLGTNIPFEAIQDNSFSVFPNPTSNLININSPLEITQLQLFDVFGKLLVEQKSIHSTKAQISTSSFGNGVYYIKLLSNKGIESQQKVVVCR